MHALAASQGKGPVSADIEQLSPLIHFYVSIMDGTGDVERLLGLHASFLEHHNGDPQNFMAEACLELAHEGPRREHELCDKRDDGTLLLRPFSRSCAMLWRTLYGRRFACYKQRANVGIKKTGWRLHGSMKIVQLLQKKATDALVKQATDDDGVADDRPTIVGINRRALIRDVRRLPATKPGKGLLDFRKTTVQRQAKKASMRVWTGIEKPNLRRKPGEHIANMLAAPRRSQGTWMQRTRRDRAHRDIPLAASQRGRRAVEQGTGKRPLSAVLDVCDDNGRDYKQTRVENFQNGNATVVVPSHSDLDKLAATSNMLIVWLAAIAHGKTVRSRAEQTSRQFAPALSTKVAIDFDGDFVRKHKVMTQAFRGLMKRKGSQWREAKPNSKGSFKIAGLTDCQKFLQNVRSFPLLAGVSCKIGGKAFTPQSLYRGHISRYGRLAVGARHH